MDGCAIGTWPRRPQPESRRRRKRCKAGLGASSCFSRSELYDAFRRQPLRRISLAKDAAVIRHRLKVEGQIGAAIDSRKRNIPLLKVVPHRTTIRDGWIGEVVKLENPINVGGTECVAECLRVQ